MRACAQGRWHLKLWKRNTWPGPTNKALRVRYRCRSWRHPGRCAVERSQEDFARIRGALIGAEPRHVVFMVLTFDSADWEDEQQAYKDLRDRWRSFAKAVRREWGFMKYVSTVEKTRRGWPHLNVILLCPGMGDGLVTMPEYVRQWVKDHANACGFGYIASVEAARSVEQVAGYVVKLADLASVGEAPRQVGGETVGEVVKLSQLPRNAPKGFRRLRSSTGFLPDVRPESEYTGQLELFPHPDDMPPEQREQLARWEAHLRWEQLSEEERDALQKWEAQTEAAHAKEAGDDEVRARWAGCKPGEVFLLDIGPPPEGEEWIDGAWREIAEQRRYALELVRAQVMQEELF